MRKIKFRAWDVTYKGFVYDFKPFLEADTNILNLSNFAEYDGGYIFEQFTGLYDCDGKEIYEGDILKDNIGIGEVFYCNRSASFMCMVDGKDSEGKLFFLNEGDPFRKTKLEYTKVIGNIHEAH